MKQKYLLPALMFFYFTAGASLFPFFTIYLGQFLTPDKIGILMAIIPAAMLVFQPLWGWAADKWGTRRMLILLLTLSALSASGLIFARSFTGFFAVLALYALFVAPVASLIDSTVLSVTPDRYGSVRLWGSAGYGAGVFFSGLFKSLLLGFWSFVIHIGLLLVTLMLVSKIKVNQPLSNHTSTKYARFHERFAFLKTGRFMILLFSLFLTGMVSKGYDNFFPVGLNALNAPDWLMGTTWVIEIIPEIILFYYLDKLTNKISSWTIIIAGTAVFSIRMMILGSLPFLWTWVASQPLASLAFCLWYFGAIKTINQLTPESHRSSGQAAFWAVSYGAGG